MEGRGRGARSGELGSVRAIVYCVVPHALAAKLHEPLRRHFAGNDQLEVVVERRGGERRRAERRGRQEAELGGVEERRRIRNRFGRRIADRRAVALPSATPSLPRYARRYAGRLAFVERLEPLGADAEDTETARLITRFQAGDAAQFTELYMRYFDRVYNYLRVILDNAHDAEEGVQQVFVSVLEALPGYEQRRVPFRGWLFIIARNYAISELRKRKRVAATDPVELERDREPPEATDAPLAQSFDWISDRELVMFIERLPLAQRQVLVLRYMLDLSHAEIATLLERSPEDVRAQLSRAQRFLRARLAAIGRTPSSSRGRAPMTRRPAHAYLLRRRRFALMR